MVTAGRGGFWELEECPHYAPSIHPLINVEINLFFPHMVFRSLAEVNTLSADDGPLRWVPVVENVIPIVINRKQVQKTLY